MKPRRLGLSTLVLLIFLAMLAVYAELIRRSPLPRHILTRQIEARTGLLARARDLDIRWTGPTTLGHLDLRAGPDQPTTVEIDGLRLEHAPLWRMLLPGSSLPQRIDIHRLCMTLARDGRGRWNLPADPGDDQPTTLGPGQLTLPAVAVDALELRLELNNQDLSFGPVRVVGVAPQDAAYLLIVESSDDGRLRLKIDHARWSGGQGLTGILRGLDAQVSVAYDGLNMSSLLHERAPAASLVGQYAGSFSFAAGPDRPADRACELKFSVSADPASTPPLAGGHGRIIADLSNASTPRFVLRESLWEFIDGRLAVWGRISRAGDGWNAFVEIEPRDLSLPTLARLVNVFESAPRGRLTGVIRFMTPLGRLHRAFGEAELLVRDSDLGNHGLLALVYNVAHLRADTRELTGHGRAMLRLDGRRLIVSSFHYTNRGSDLFATGRLEDVYHGLASPLTAIALASNRPLPDLPLAAQLNDILSVLTSGIAAVRIDGTFMQPRVRPLPLADTRSAITDFWQTGQASEIAE